MSELPDDNQRHLNKGEGFTHFTGDDCPDASDPDTEGAKSSEITSSRTLAQGESEELEQLDKIFKRYWPRTILYHSKPQEPWKLDKAKKAVLQWRTKSLLALLPEEEYEGPNNDPHDEHYAHGYNVALQDIKKGIK